MDSNISQRRNATERGSPTFAVADREAKERAWHELDAWPDVARLLERLWKALRRRRKRQVGTRAEEPCRSRDRVFA